MVSNLSDIGTPDDTEIQGITPSFEPTLLKYPAENPPVNAPCSLLRPFSSRTYRLLA